MRGKNPFTLSFGRVPNEYVTRHAEEDHIVDMFTELPITDHICAAGRARERKNRDDDQCYAAHR